MKIIFIASLLVLSCSANLEDSSDGYIPIDETVPEDLSNEFIKNQTANSVRGRITYGIRASNGQFPFMAWLFMRVNDNSGTVCGGTLIKSDFVLTAAHCLGSFRAIDVFFGSVDKNTFPVRKSGIGYWKHLSYVDPNVRGVAIHADIGLIKMDSGVSYTPAILPTRATTSRNYQGVRMISIGFGGDETGALSRYLMYTFMTGVPNSNCVNRGTQICAKGDGRSENRGGDSGSGLLIGNTVVGIVSYGTGGHTGFTRVDSYLDWVGSRAGLNIK